MKTTIVFTKTESDSVEQVANGSSGFRVDIEIAEVLNITDKIFIFQREVPDADADAFVDTFYDVASVTQLESIPETADIDHPFYRKNAISLVFRTADELRLWVDKILLKIDKLRRANDSFLSLQDTTTGSFPPAATARYWGFSNGAPADEIILAGDGDSVFSEIVDTIFTKDTGPRNVFFAVRADIPTITLLKINGSSVSFTSSTRSITNADGYATSYRIYLTSATVASNNVNLLTTAHT